MSDYQSTWKLRQEYYSPEAVDRRALEQMERNTAEFHLQEIEREQTDLLSPDNVGAGLRRPVEQPKGRAEDTGETLATIGANAGERALDAIPSIGVGVIAMADNILDFGAHVVGLEDYYAQASKWLDDNVELHQATTSTGPIVAAISQIMIPFAGTAKALQAAGFSNLVSGLIASGTAEGLAIAPANMNFAEMVKGFTAAEPGAPEAAHNALLEALSKTPQELAILAQADARAEAGESITEPSADFDPEAYREVYFEARLKNAMAGVVTEGVAEALMLGARGIFRTSKALADPAARKALMRSVARSVNELDAGAPQSLSALGEAGLEGLTPAAGARALVAAPVDGAEQILKEAKLLQQATAARRVAVVATPASEASAAPAARLAAAITGAAVPAGSALSAPAGASEDDVRTWLRVLAGELGQETLSARRFGYLAAPPEDMEGKATSVLYGAAEAPSPAQLEVFRRRLGGRHQVDVKPAGTGVVLDVHPSDGTPADPALLEAAVREAGLDPDASQVVFSEYSEISVNSTESERALPRWQASIEREEAKAFAGEVGGMAAARAIIRGEAEPPAGVRGGTRTPLHQRISKARARVKARMAEADGAVGEVRGVLDADARRALMLEVAQ